MKPSKELNKIGQLQKTLISTLILRYFFTANTKVLFFYVLKYHLIFVIFVLREMKIRGTSFHDVADFILFVEFN